ncbi:MAG: (Fe-S)-binding protein [Dehalococcoidia bacterium]
MNTDMDGAGSCTRCGLCLSVCPTYREEALEPLAPRGRVALVRHLTQGGLSPSRRLARYIDSCLGCLACTEVCPSGVEVEKLIRGARARVQVGRRGSLKRRLVEHVLPTRRGQEIAGLPLRLFRRSGMARLLPPPLRIIDDLPPLSRPLRRRLPRVVEAGKGRKRRVGYFLSCAQNLIYPDTARAALDVLARGSCEVVVPRGVECCGMPFMASGHIERARDLARRNLDAFAGSGAEAVITDCATCGSFLRGYDELLGNDPQYAGEARSFSRKVRDISQFLVQDLEPVGGLRESPVRVTYHDPCHLVRGQGVSREPRDILRLIPGLELVEMENADWCCGGAGTYVLDHYELSQGVLARKVASIAATGAEIVATGCPSCRLQIGRGLRAAGIRAEVVHPVELLHRALPHP